MRSNRRTVLRALGVAVGAGVAGCNTDSLVGGGTESDGETGTPGSTAEATDGTASPSGRPDVAVAAQWNVYRARAFDALALGRAGETDLGAATVEATFGDFEGATGEYGAHEMLEATSEDAYEGFEGALEELRSALSDGDVDAAADAAESASSNLASAQTELVGETASHALDLQALGARAATAEALAAVEAFDAAGTIASETFAAFEEAAVHDELESADGDVYESFESSLSDLESAASDGDAEAVREHARAALEAAVDGSYAVADAETTAGTGHLAAMQARGYDAAALADLGGPGEDLAHAAVLNTYRVRVADAPGLVAADATDRAAAVGENVFAHFEGARAHEALEEADHDAYESFEGGLESLQTAASEGDAGGVDEAVGTIDDALVAGIEALAGEQAAVVESGFVRARLADARERYRRGDADAAHAIAQGVFERFEADELGFHETLEHESEDLYERFEHEHLESLIEAYDAGDDEAVATHHDGAQQALVEFEAAHDAAVASAAETAFVVGRAFDAAALAAVGDADRAAAVATETFEHFEAGAAGYHEALEHADHERYEAFEEALGAVRAAAEEDGDVAAAASEFNAEAVQGLYAIVGASGGSQSEAAAGIVQDVFAVFEGAQVHELLEEADHDAYETFEGELDAYASALEEGGDVDAALDAFARATLRAQFAVAGDVEAAPVDAGGDSEETETETDLQGGPNVVEGVPDDADHVVDMTAVAFEPAELTVSVGDTVAWKHAGGEPHSVTARGDGIPEGADYWASGDFDGEDAAVEGWENGEGAVQSGESYVHTFETAGEHAYYCVPHEAAGMEGTVVVEE